MGAVQDGPLILGRKYISYLYVLSYPFISIFCMLSIYKTASCKCVWFINKCTYGQDVYSNTRMNNEKSLQNIRFPKRKCGS